MLYVYAVLNYIYSLYNMFYIHHVYTHTQDAETQRLKRARQHDQQQHGHGTPLYDRYVGPLGIRCVPGIYLLLRIHIHAQFNTIIGMQAIAHSFFIHQAMLVRCCSDSSDFVERLLRCSNNSQLVIANALTARTATYCNYYCCCYHTNTNHYHCYCYQLYIATVYQSIGKGRGLVATRAVAQGEVLMISNPLAVTDAHPCQFTTTGLLTSKLLEAVTVKVACHLDVY
jgi:hypothetical protein